MTNSPGERLRRRWAEGTVRGAAAATELDALERDLGIILPSAFKDYLAIVDGMESGKWVGAAIDFWPVARLRADWDGWGCFEPGKEGTLLPFADLLLDSHAYAIRVSSPDASVFIVSGNGEPIACASSFDEFVSRYEQDDDALYGGATADP